MYSTTPHTDLFQSETYFLLIDERHVDITLENTNIENTIVRWLFLQRTRGGCDFEDEAEMGSC